jgi:hypothetical protein
MHRLQMPAPVWDCRLMLWIRRSLAHHCLDSKVVVVSRTTHYSPGWISTADLAGYPQHCARFGRGQLEGMAVDALHPLLDGAAVEDLVLMAMSTLKKTCSWCSSVSEAHWVQQPGSCLECMVGHGYPSMGSGRSRHRLLAGKVCSWDRSICMMEHTSSNS